MSDDFSTDPRKALETSLTALLLGELPEDQARFLREAIATDPDLAKTFESLKTTIGLIQEAQTTPRVEREETTSALKLSEERRMALLEQFRTVRPAEFSRSTQKSSSWLVPLAAAVALLAVLTPLLLTSLGRSKSRSMADRGEAAVERLVQLRENLNRAQPVPRPDSRQLAGLRSQNEAFRKRFEPPQQVTQSASLTDSLASEAKNPLASSETPPDSGNSIFLPPLSKGDEIVTSSAEQPVSRDLQYYTFAPPEKAAAPAINNSYSPFGIGQGGRVGGAGQAVPMLGDTPLLGRAFQEQDKNLNTPTPLPALQLETNALSWNYPAGAMYGGGAFGGYSTISLLPPGEVHQVVTIPGVGQVPVASRQLAEASAKSELTRRTPESKPASQTEEASKQKLELGKEVALAKDQFYGRAAGENLKQLAQENETLDKKAHLRAKLAETRSGVDVNQLDDAAALKPATPPPAPLPEIATKENPFSTFSLNVSDVSFKLAAAGLEKGVLPDPGTVRSEEFLNAFDYRDPEPSPGAMVGFASESAQDPFAQNRDLLRFSIKTAAIGRQAGRPLNLVLLLDNSGSMERADRVAIIREALRVLASQLHSQDTLSVVTFARTARLWIDGVAGDQAGRIVDELSGLTPQGGTNLEEAMNLAYQTALRHYNATGINRVVLLTDGAANLGDTNPDVLRQKVETNRKQGIALDCFGIGWEGYNDTLLEELTRHGDGRYGFINAPEEAASGFAAQLAGALQVAASDVKVQVEFNPARVASYRQIGYAQHQLTKEQFRDNTVDAAEIGAAESGNALYVIETKAQGEGPLATVRVRFKVPDTTEYREQEWTVPFSGRPAPLEQASPAMRLAAVSSAFAEWLAQSPFAAEVTPDRLVNYLSGVPAAYGADPRPQKLEWMVRQAKAISGK